MIYLSNTLGVNLIQSLPKAWRTMFSQGDQLRTAYEAAEQVIAQAYLDIMQDTKGVNIQKQSVFRRLLFRYHTLSETDGFRVPGFPGQPDTWMFPVEIAERRWKINKIRYIGNSLVAPSVFLENGVDFQMVIDGSVDLTQARGRAPHLPNLDYVEFMEDPFANKAFAHKVADEEFYNIVSPIGAAVDYAGLGITGGTGHTVRVTFSADGKTFELPITDVAISQLVFEPTYLSVMDSDVDRLKSRGFKFTVLDPFKVPITPLSNGRFVSQTLRVRKIAVWFADLLVDDYALAEVYGALLNVQETSTESYKNLLRGLLQYYVGGNSIGRTTSAVHVVAGLPVFDTDGESVLEISTTGADATILTDHTLYTTDPKFPLNHDVLLAAASIDGNVPDNTGRWAVVPKNVDLRALQVNGSHKLRIADGTSVGVPFVADIVKVYNNQRILLSQSTPVLAGEGVYYGYSIGSNSPDYDNVVPYETDVFVTIENFTQSDHAFKQLDPITDAIRVEDYRTHPAWWNSRVVPSELFEDEDLQRRTAAGRYQSNKIGSPGLKIGDPMWKIGRDESNLGPEDIGAVIQLPYYNPSEPSGKTFRVGELVQTMTGVGNGEGRVLYHDKTSQILYVRIERGRFFVWDEVRGAYSHATAKLATRSHVVLESNAGMLVGSYYNSKNLSFGMGVAEGRYAIRIDDKHIELFECSTRQVQPGDTFTVGFVSSIVESVHTLPFAVSHRDVASYMMDSVWQYAMLHIAYDFNSFKFPRGLDRLREIVMSGAEDRLFVHIEPFTGFIDYIPPPDDTTFSLEFGVGVEDSVIDFDTQIKFGGPGVLGSVWQFGETGYVIGGANPAYTTVNAESYVGGGGVADLAIDIVVS